LHTHLHNTNTLLPLFVTVEDFFVWSNSPLNPYNCLKMNLKITKTLIKLVKIEVKDEEKEELQET